MHASESYRNIIWLLGKCSEGLDCIQSTELKSGKPTAYSGTYSQGRGRVVWDHRLDQYKHGSGPGRKAAWRHVSANNFHCSLIYQADETEALLNKLPLTAKQKIKINVKPTNKSQFIHSSVQQKSLYSSIKREDIFPVTFSLKG